MTDPVDYVPFETTTTPVNSGTGDTPELERLYDVPVELAVEIGRTYMTIRETLSLGPGSIVEEFGLRVTEVVSNDPESERVAEPHVEPLVPPVVAEPASVPQA
jgi:hypothetical protein